MALDGTLGGWGRRPSQGLVVEKEAVQDTDMKMSKAASLTPMQGGGASATNPCPGLHQRARVIMS